MRTSAKLAALSVFYFVQGLPYGFQLVALPVYLRAEGVSLTGIAFASALALPWLFKVVWGPLVDRFGHPAFGRRRSWIVPLQLLLGVSCFAAAVVEPSRGLLLLLVLIFLMNLFAATMDVAVDGLAVDLLEPEELGYGNVAQVVGYKVGMLAGGGLLVWASRVIGWQGLFVGMGSLVVLGAAVGLAFREPRPAPGTRTEEQASVSAVLRTLGRALRLPGTGWILLFVASYKLGESMADAMFKPFLYDRGFGAAEIGLWVGSWGMAFSIAGSFLGGVLASRLPRLTAVGVTAALRSVAVAGEWWLAVVGPTVGRLAAVTAAEQLLGGSLTTAMFAFMMSKVDRRVGATHYTLLATVEVAGKMAAGWASGPIAERWGYVSLFALATLLSLAYLGLLVPLSRSSGGGALRRRSGYGKDIART